MKVNFCVLIILTVLVSACATEQKSNFSEFNSEALYPNKRIVFRDVTIAPPAHKRHISRKHLNKTQTESFSKNHDLQSITEVSAVYPISKEAYGESIDNRFNDVSDVIVVPRRIFNSGQRAMQKNIQSNDMSQRSVSQPETKYASLSFPARPPESLIKKFHMQIRPRIDI